MSLEQRNAERIAFEAAVTGAMEPGMSISTARDSQGRYRAIGMNTFWKVWSAAKRHGDDVDAKRWRHMRDFHYEGEITEESVDASMAAAAIKSVIRDFRTTDAPEAK